MPTHSPHLTLTPHHERNEPTCRIFTQHIPSHVSVLSHRVTIPPPAAPPPIRVRHPRGQKHHRRSIEHGVPGRSPRRHPPPLVHPQLGVHDPGGVLKRGRQRVHGLVKVGQHPPHRRARVFHVVVDAYELGALGAQPSHFIEFPSHVLIVVADHIEAHKFIRPLRVHILHRRGDVEVLFQLVHDPRTRL